MDIIIKICNLGYKMNGNKILNGINLEIKKNKLVGLIGPNGSGKSTLLKCINRINIAEGSIIINKKNLDAYTDIELARTIAFLNQNTNVTFPFHCEEVVMMGRYPYQQNRRTNKLEDLKIVEESIKFTHTEKLSKKLITQISGGEKQRVMMAKVLAQNANILLLDEPTSSLDIKHEEEIFKLSKNLVKKGSTIILAVHDIRVGNKILR